jgi:hypothetical protein
MTDSKQLFWLFTWGLADIDLGAVVRTSQPTTVDL